MSNAVSWGVPGTTNPGACNIFDIMARSARGESTTSSEVIISYYFLDEALAIEIATQALSPKQAEMFHKIRAIDPMQFQPRRKWWQFFAKPRVVTWRDYANHLGYDDQSWWDACKGISYEVQHYLKARNQSS